MTFRHPEPSIPLHGLAWASALLPLFTFHLSFVISTVEHIFPACVPYWIDCTSISHGGRHGTAYFVFKGGMLLSAFLLALFWHLQDQWHTKITRTVSYRFTWLGGIGSLALVMYSLFLGHAGDEFRLVRRFGVVLFMFCTFCAHALSAWISYQYSGERARVILCGLLLTIAIVSLLLDITLGSTYDRMENAFEWWMMLGLCINHCLLARHWKREGYGVRLVSGRHD